MAEKTVINGVESGSYDQTGESFYDINEETPHSNNTNVSEMVLKIDALEREKVELLHENREIKDRIGSLTSQVELLKEESDELKNRLVQLEGEMAASEEGTKALDFIAARSVELETEVSRLQQDLLSAMSERELASSEVEELKKVLSVKGSKIDESEGEIENLKKSKAETDKKLRELERKVGVLEMREIEEKSKKIRAEEETRDRIKEKETEIATFEKKVESLELELAKKEIEVEKWQAEKKIMEKALGESKDKANALEFSMIELQKVADVTGKAINGLKERTIQAVDDEGKAKMQWPVVAVGSAGAIAVAVAAAAVYVCYSRPR